MDINTALEKTLNKIETWIGAFIESLPNIVVALLITVGFFFLAKLIRKGFLKVIGRFSDSITVNRLLSNIMYVGVIFTGIFIALGVLHLDKTVTSLLAGAGIIGLALSFAFQDVAANFISGIYIAINRPIQQNDHILSNNLEGRVKRVNLRSTEIETFQGQIVTLPNRKIFENPITNFSRKKERRIDLEVGISYSDDPEKAEKVAKKAIQSLGKSLTKEEINVWFTGFGGSSVNMVITYWCDSGTNACFLKARSQGIKAIKKAFAREEISIPFPIRTLEFSPDGQKSLLDFANQVN